MGLFGKSYTLKCGFCGEIYRIGKDAFLVTQADIRAARMEEGGCLVTSAPPPPVPDLAMHDPNVGKEADKELKKAEEISSAISQGQVRYWRCNKCSDKDKINQYPASW